MESKHVVNIAGTTCPPEYAVAFSEWYYHRHIPITMRFKGLARVTRYKLANEGCPPNQPYPTYMTLYRFANMETFKDWNISAELAAASEGATTLFAQWGVESVWRVQYECVRSCGIAAPMSTIELTAVPPDTRLDRWRDCVGHPPQSRRALGIIHYRFVDAIGLGVRIAGGVPIGKTKTYPTDLTLTYCRMSATSDPGQRNSQEDDISCQQEIPPGVHQGWQAVYTPLMNWEQPENQCSD